MSDSVRTALSILRNWKFGLAVGVPCFAIGLVVTFHYFTRDARNALAISIAEEECEIQGCRGNEEYTLGNYDKAIEYYTLALLICPQSKIILMSRVYQNRAAAYEKLQKYDLCVLDCDKALELVPNYTKALSRRAKAFVEMGKYELAYEDVLTLVLMNQFEDKAEELYTKSVLSQLGQKKIKEFRNSETDESIQDFVDKYLTSLKNNVYDNEF